MFLLNLCQATLRFKHISVMACSLNDCSDRHYDYLGRICIFAQYSFFCTRFYEQLAASEVVRHISRPPLQGWFARPGVVRHLRDGSLPHMSTTSSGVVRAEVVRHLRGGSPRGCPPPQRWFAARAVQLSLFDNSLRFL